jgi:Spy/CpxP family protein refolding chaperone
MGFSSLLLGLAGGVLGAKLVGLRRSHHWGRHHRGRGLFRALRGLGLARAQKQALWSVARDVRQSLGDVRFGAFEGMDALFDAVTGDDFDRPSVESMAQRKGQAVGTLREKLVAAAEKVHSILTPEQRRQLRERMGLASAGGPDGGPYRTAL